MVGQSAGGIGQKRLALEEVLPIAHGGSGGRYGARGRGREKQQAVVSDGNDATKSRAIKFATKAEGVLAARVAQSVLIGESVAKGSLELSWIGADLKTGEGEAIDVWRTVVGWAIDAQLLDIDDRDISEVIADDGGAKKEFVDQCVGEGVGLGNSSKAIPQGNIEGKIQIVGRGYAAGLDLERVGAEGQVLLGICPEEAEGEAILPPGKFLVPIGGELIIGEPARGTHDEGSGIHTGAASPGS